MVPGIFPSQLEILSMQAIDFRLVNTELQPAFCLLGYRIVVHSFQAKEPLGHQTNLRYAGTTA